MPVGPDGLKCVATRVGCLPTGKFGIDLFMKRFVATLLLLLWSISFADPAGAGLRVWCVGADGHSGIESLVGVKCGSASVSDPDLKSPVVLVSDDHCGPCADIALKSDISGAPSIAAVPTPAEKSLSEPVIALSVLVVLDNQPAARIAVDNDPPSSSPHLLEHQSVVLLI